MANYFDTCLIRSLLMIGGLAGLAGCNGGADHNADAPDATDSSDAEALVDGGSVQDTTTPDDDGIQDRPDMNPDSSSAGDAAKDAADMAMAPDECDHQDDISECTLGAYADRPYYVTVPSTYTDDTPVPVLFAFHGGASSADGMRRVTCPGGTLTDPDCLDAVGETEGFAIVYPSGTQSAAVDRDSRTWNAGGGSDGWNCVSGRACATSVDDVAYFDALLDHLGTWLTVDESRIYATGISNGAAMAHRLACERSGDIAAIAAVAGANQFATLESCEPASPVAVLQIHGTEDPCWTYEQSDAACLAQGGGDKIGVTESNDVWATALGCTNGPQVDTLIDNVFDDDTAVEGELWSGCSAPLQNWRIVGGGHTWPSGFQYLAEATVGRVSQEIDHAMIWEFLSANTR